MEVCDELAVHDAGMRYLPNHLLTTIHNNVTICNNSMQ